MSRLAELRREFMDYDEIKLPIPPIPDDAPKGERQRVCQRLRVALKEAAWKAGVTIELKTTDTEVTATVTSRP